MTSGTVNGKSRHAIEGLVWTSIAYDGREGYWSLSESATEESNLFMIDPGLELVRLTDKSSFLLYPYTESG